jgi:LAO/AO transport system kinase
MTPAVVLEIESSFMPHPTINSPLVTRRRDLAVSEYVAGVLSGDRVTLGRAITLVESTLPAHEAMAEELILQLLPHTGKALRFGITGIPGAGKSTFIEALGGRLTEAGHKVAVLAIDPSSTISGGSILGDKTRMQELSANPNAFIRPSPSSGTLGGVTRKTRETLLVCEAFGFDVVIIETVGTGQSEAVVDDMVDCFLLLMVAGAGDELQGIKRGVLELADIVAVNKADGDNEARAELARRQYATGLHFMRPKIQSWTPQAVVCSARTGKGLDELWTLVQAHRQALTQSGDFAAHRQQQLVRWMWSMINERLLTAMREHPAVKERILPLEQAVTEGKVTASQAAAALLEAFGVETG